MREPEIDRQRQDVHAEWRAWLQALGYRCQAHLAAARTMPGIPLHSGYHRPNWRQVYFVAKLVQHLVGIRQCRSAMHTAQGLGHHCLVWIAGEWPATTLPPRLPW